ncbi:MAG: hypothetical protein WCK03_03565, partial [Candidatus Taylorbacteria bacterium]
MIALNYIVDPTGLFSKASSQPEVKLAKILAGNSNALIGSNYDERIFQILHAKTETQHAPIIITGSSRMMPVSSAMLAIPCLNVAVSSASLEDHIALGIAAKKRKRNQVFLLGVDPWVFNGNLGPIGWRSIGKDYVKAAKAVHLTEIPVLEK